MSTGADRLVIGLGNPLAGDDAAGLLVVRSLKDRLPDTVVAIEHEGEPTTLLDVWAGAELVIVVDAVKGRSPPGTIHRLDASKGPLPASLVAYSTHAFDLAAVIELARELRRVPRRLIVIGIEARSFEAGDVLDAKVAAALEPAAAAVLEEVGFV
jgi:hydrogenase maturation protease